LKHGAFASYDPMVLASFAIKERRKNVRKENLTRAFEVALRAVETLRHHAEVHMLCAENVADLADHFVDAHVRAGVARAVVAGKQQLEFFARTPLSAAAEHPLQAVKLRKPADPSDEEEIERSGAEPVGRVT